jgi:hypothetical protein
MLAQGDLARARALAEQCLALERETHTEADLLAVLGEIIMYQGDTTTTGSLLEQN